LKIEVEKKFIYGGKKYYPICKLAHLFTSLTGTKTLTIKALGIIRKMGIKIEEKK